MHKSTRNEGAKRRRSSNSHARAIILGKLSSICLLGFLEIHRGGETLGVPVEAECTTTWAREDRASKIVEAFGDFWKLVLLFAVSSEA